MNLHATIDEASAVATSDDAIARVLSQAKLADETALLSALSARQVELGLSNEALENLAGLCRGHVQKVCGPSRERSPTLRTVDRMLTALGLSIILIRDPEKFDRVTQHPRRDESHVRSRLSAGTIKRARPIIIDELLRRAARRRWRGVPTRDFLRAQAGRNP
jgi:DNA-binding phage protein